jgi:GMP synthase-like glutamine amidotransferase
MRLGLLQCDHVPPDLLHIAGDYDHMFATWLPADWRIYDVVNGHAPRHLDECDAYLSTGSKSSVYDDEPWIHQFADLVRQIHAENIPFAGVCFGHQMLGHALGGEARKSPRGWGVGVHAFRTVASQPWMKPSASTVHVLMSCQDQVEKLPPNAELLLASEFCPHAAFRIGNCLGIQGHPEFPVEYSEAVLERRAVRIGVETVEQARHSYRTPPDSPLLAAWIRNFLQTAAETKLS